MNPLDIATIVVALTGPLVGWLTYRQAVRTKAEMAAENKRLQAQNDSLEMRKLDAETAERIIRRLEGDIARLQRQLDEARAEIEAKDRRDRRNRRLEARLAETEVTVRHLTGEVQMLRAHFDER